MTMIDEIKQIRKILDKLEDSANSTKNITETPLSGLELPDIIRDIVDLLYPNLTPYEASFYIFFIRNSILENGQPYIRIGGRTLSKAIKSARSGTNSGGNGQVTKISDAQVKVTLEGLQSIGAIRKENDPDRNGTLYRIMLPEEIEACQQYREKIELEKNTLIKKSLNLNADYYNVRENRFKVYEKDNYKCKYCQKQLTRFTATLDHIKPVSLGGDNSLENLVTACLDCNSRKNSKPLGDFFAERNH